MISAQAREAQILELLKSRYQSQGYTFIAHPGREILPAFLSGYTPDAIALKDAEKLAIEIKQSKSNATGERLDAISRRFSGQAGWRLVVFLSTDVENLLLSPTTSTSQKIRSELDKSKNLADRGEYSAAFIIAWGAFEAAARARDPDQTKKVISPKSVVESLERNGFVSASVGADLRRYITFRNAIVHGDYKKVPTKRQVKSLIRHTRNLLQD